jgi:hypothetical protein
MKKPLSDRDKITLFSKLDKLNVSRNPIDVAWYWDSSMHLNDGNLGAYWAVGDYICLAEDSRFMVINSKDMLPSIAHELKHAEQRKRMGLLKYKFLANRLWAEATVEKEAEAEETRVRKLLGLESGATDED